MTVKIKCQLCGGKVQYKELKTVKGSFNYNEFTHIWVCDDCPMVMFEYYDKQNTKTINKYLEQ